MSMVFGDFVVKLFTKLGDSLKPCCSPTPDTIDQLDSLRRTDSRSRRGSLYNVSTAELGELDDADPIDSVYEYFDDRFHREAVLFWGFFRRIDPAALRRYDRSPIVNLALTFYCVSSHRGVRRLFLVAEQCAAPSYPSLDDSADEIDDDDAPALFGGKRRAPPFLRPTATQQFGGIYVAEMAESAAKGISAHRDSRYVNVFEMDDPQRLSVLGSEWILKFAAMATAKDILLPPSVHRTLWEQHAAKHRLFRHCPPGDALKAGRLREYTVLFKLCGSGPTGWTDSCSAVVFDESALRHDPHREGLFAMSWNLPRFPLKTGGSAVAFSPRHGLLSVGGYRSAQCHALSFSSPSFVGQTLEWQWAALPAMSESRWFPSCAMMDADTLVAAAGSSADHEPLRSVEVLRFDDSDSGSGGGGGTAAAAMWRPLASCHRARKYGGLSAAGTSGQLLLGGGDHATHSVESFDAEQNRWTELPDTERPHRYYPNLWRDAANESLIYISCSYSNCVERLDLRASDGRWRTVGPALFDTDALDLDHNQFRCVL